MGNCHTAAVVVVHPGYKVKRIRRLVIAGDVMNSNPGHFVAEVVKSPEVKLINRLPVTHFQLLQASDSLLVGQVYRLIGYEDVLKEFAAKKCMKLGKLLMDRGVIQPAKKMETAGAPVPVPDVCSVKRRETEGRKLHKGQGGRQWKPALKSISEIGIELYLF